jgi:triacylglycerol lipase
MNPKIRNVLILITVALPCAAASANEPVVLLHGLARTTSSMTSMAESLASAGYRVCNVAYPSREHDIRTLTMNYVLPEIARCFPNDTKPVHFVTHSLGGIIVRQLAASGTFTRFGRVVMLSPPNQGSEVVDELGDLWLFQALNGPAGNELSTAVVSTPNKLGPAPFELGIITGTRSVNLILSMFIPGTDDGKVSVQRAKLEGMKDFLEVPSSHPFIMTNAAVIQQTIHFLKHGVFLRDDVTQRPQVVGANR